MLGDGAAELDEAEDYSINLFTGRREEPEDRTMASGCVKLALDCAATNDRRLMGRFTLEVSQVVQAYGPHPERHGGNDKGNRAEP